MRAALLRTSAVVGQDLFRVHKKAIMLPRVHASPASAVRQKNHACTQHVCRYASLPALSPGSKVFALPQERVS